MAKTYEKNARTKRYEPKQANKMKMAALVLVMAVVMVEAIRLVVAKASGSGTLYERLFRVELVRKLVDE